MESQEPLAIASMSQIHLAFIGSGACIISAETSRPVSVGWKSRWLGPPRLRWRMWSTTHQMSRNSAELTHRADVYLRSEKPAVAIFAQRTAQTWPYTFAQGVWD